MKDVAGVALPVKQPTPGHGSTRKCVDNTSATIKKDHPVGLDRKSKDGNVDPVGLTRKCVDNVSATVNNDLCTYSY